LSGHSSHAALLASCRAGAEDLAARLKRLLAGREDGFLDLGRRVMDFSGRTRSLEALAADLAALASGPEIGDGIGRLAAEMEIMSGACDAEKGEASLAELEAVLGIIGRLAKAVESFGRLVRRLQMLAVSTRIESARLGSRGAGFSTLADDVEALAGKIVS